MQELENEAVRARNARQDKVERDLRAHPMDRYALDLAAVPLKAAPGAPVSVVLAVRHGEQILSGEILIPANGETSAPSRPSSTRPRQRCPREGVHR
jgi:hypothetical protein